MEVDKPQPETIEIPSPDKSLLDKITADPEFINRSAAEAVESVVAVPVATPKSQDLPEQAEPIVLDRDDAHRVPQVNLLPPKEVSPHKRKVWPLVVAVVVALLVAGGAGGYVLLNKQPAEQPMAQITPSRIPSPTPTPTPLSTPTPTTVPTPSATPVPETITAPVVAPTADHPQAVKITSKSGLWLRSSASSANRNNIIGWMPNGATVSVDQVGDFWWHGMYKGQAGYFASKYTQ